MSAELIQLFSNISEHLSCEQSVELWEQAVGCVRQHHLEMVGERTVCIQHLKTRSPLTGVSHSSLLCNRLLFFAQIHLHYLAT